MSRGARIRGRIALRRLRLSAGAVARARVAGAAVVTAGVAMVAVAAVVLATIVFATPATAGTPGTLTGLPGSGTPAGAGAPVSAPGLPPGSALKLILGIVVVLAAIFALQRLARVTGHRLGATGSGPEEIRIVSQRPVGPRLSLALVQVMGRSFLVGVSPQGIRPVADLGEAAAAILPPVRAAGERASLRVPDLLRGIFGFSARRDASATAGPAESVGSSGSAAVASTGSPVLEPLEEAGFGAPSGAGFESELARRLAAFRERYRTVGEILPEPEGERS